MKNPIKDVEEEPSDTTESRASCEELVKAQAKNHSEKILNSLAELEKNTERLTDKELKNKIFSLLKGSLEEIIDKNTTVHYTGVLRRVKDSYDEHMVDCAKEQQSKICSLQQEISTMRTEAGKEKRRADKLEKENIELTKEYEKQSALIDSQKIVIKELKKQASEGNNECKTESGSKTQKEKIESLMSELKSLYNENNKLDLTAKKLNYDLKQSKIRELTLTKMLKGNSAILSSTVGNASGLKENKKTDTMGVNNILKESKELNKSGKKGVEIGKNKVIVPKLDFSKLAQKKLAQITVVQCESSASESSANGSKGNLQINIEQNDVKKEEIDPENFLDKAIDNIDDLSSSWRDALKDK